MVIQDNRVVFVNEAVSQINGYNNEEMLAWPPLRFLEQIHPDDRAPCA